MALNSPKNVAVNYLKLYLIKIMLRSIYYLFIYLSFIFTYTFALWTAGWSAKCNNKFFIFSLSNSDREFSFPLLNKT